MNHHEASLIIASSEEDANLYYASHFLVPDPVIYFEIEGEKNLILSDLEIDRARLEARVDHLHSLSHFLRRMRSNGHHPRKGIPIYALVVDSLFKKRKINTINVPTNFPAQYYVSLKKLGYSITIKTDPFYENRLVKSIEEKNYVQGALQKVEKALKEALLILEKSKIKGNKIYDGREIITSETMQQVINTKLMELGCVASHTIVASGRQGSLPHHGGSGPLVAHTPIIFDIFPRDSHSRYNADMTRTVVKGRPSPVAKKMYAAVLESNLKAQEKVSEGVLGSEIHQEVVSVIKSYGFKTGKINGRMQGFIHSTGHGLGLDVHEPPSVSPVGGPLKKGNIITIEPGLYYEKHGGVRIEDVVYVTRTGCETLTKFPTFFEIDRA